mgnify:CR=1 FL=1
MTVIFLKLYSQKWEKGNIKVMYLGAKNLLTVNRPCQANLKVAKQGWLILRILIWGISAGEKTSFQFKEGMIHIITDLIIQLVNSALGRNKVSADRQAAGYKLNKT